MIDLNYQVAEHCFQLSFAEETVEQASLSNYEPFIISENVDKYIFHLEIKEILESKEQYEEVGQFDDDIASIHVSKSITGKYCFRIAYPGSSDFCMMYTDTFFHEAKVQLPRDEKYRFFCLNNCIMLLYAFSTAKLHTLLIHASVVKKGEDGFVFLGKSGTGKSTHSRLWLENIVESELLNDDNPAIRIIGGKAFVFGTPWSGKTHCYKNDNALLKAIVKLRQAPENTLKRLLSVQAYAAVSPSCSCMRWEDDIMTGVHNTVEKLVTSVNCFHLDCLPNKKAAELLYKTVSE